GDGAPDDEVVGAGGHGRGGRGDPRLVVGCRPGGADAGGDDHRLATDGGAHGGQVGGGAHDAVGTGLHRQGSQTRDLLGGGRLADGAQGRVVEAGQDRHRQHGHVGGGLGRGRDHGRAAGGVDGQHRDAEVGDGGGRPGDGVGDVVQLEVAEHRRVGGGGAHRLRPVGGEGLQAHLEVA